MSKFPSQYEEFIYTRTYSRWLEKEGRREVWDETVDRYKDFFIGRTPDGDLRAEFLAAIEGIRCFENMPSMRSLWAAGPALERENIAGYNCFSSDTEFITLSGLRSFSEFEDGDKVNVLTKLGDFKEATVRSFGSQALQKVTLRPGARTNVRRSISTTPDHRWITSNRGEVTDLKVGDVIPSNVIDCEYRSFNTEAFIRGFGFGDGTLDSRGRAKIRLCGEKDLAYIDKFKEYGHSSLWYPGYMDGDALVVFHKGYFEDWKKLPYDKLSDVNYLHYWLMGYLAADASMNSVQPVLASQDIEAINFVDKIAPLCGYVVTGRNTLSSMETNFGIRKNPLIRLTLRADTKFYVTNIEELDTDEVFCVTEPVTSTFTLANGILTGNCAYVAIDDARAFSEILYILMNGTGCGFSVERQEVCKLPLVPDGFIDLSDNPEHDTIVFADSKKGWAEGYRKLIDHLYRGIIPHINTDKIRPKNARLKTFGGRASGPEPLIQLMKFTSNIFVNAAGRKLTSIECHDIACMIANCVVVGGVRRSAGISLSNLSDIRMRGAKDGEFWIHQPQRALSNNSVAYTEKPEMATFMDEWMALMRSGNGERGIVNREGLQKTAALLGRDPLASYGVNPCGEVILKSKQFCNL